MNRLDNSPATPTPVTPDTGQERRNKTRIGAGSAGKTRGGWTPFVLAALAWLLAAPAAAEIPGPLAAEVLAAVDGDTLRVRAAIWPGIEAVTAVRLKGADAPELKGKCAAEREAALRAKARLAELAGGRVELREVDPDKFGGRVLARVLAGDGRDIAAVLIAEGLARPYSGGKRTGWC